MKKHENKISIILNGQQGDQRDSDYNTEKDHSKGNKIQLFSGMGMILLIAITSLIGVGCNPKKSTRKRALPDGSYEASPQEVSSQFVDKDLEQILAKAEKTLSEEKAKKLKDVSIKKLMDSIIIPLDSKLYNRDFILDPDVKKIRTQSNRFILPNLMAVYTGGLTLIARSEGSANKIQSQLSELKSLLEYDCDIQLKGSCEGIKLLKFSNPPESVYLIKQIFLTEKNKVYQAFLVKSAFEVLNRSAEDKNLRLMLLKILAEEIKEENKNQEDFKRNADLFANIFKLTKNYTNKEEAYKDFINELNPWELSQVRDSSKNLALGEILSLAAKYLLYEEGKLSEDFKKYVKSLDYKIGVNYEEGIEFQLENIEGNWKKLNTKTASEEQKRVLSEIEKNKDVVLFDENSKGIKKALIPNFEITKNEYFFLIYQTYYGHYNNADTEKFWGNTKKDTDKLISTARSFIRLQIVNTILTSNTLMNQFYNENKALKILQILDKSEQQAGNIRKRWVLLMSRAKLISDLVSRLAITKNKEQKDRVDALTKDTDSLRKNVLFLVTYPEMYPLMHILAKQDLKDSIRSFWGPISIDSKTIITSFFEAKLFPWFNFGNDNQSLSTAEIIYSFYYALATEIFNTFKNSSVVNFSEEDFFNTVVKKLLESKASDLEGFKNSLSEKLKTLSGDINRAENICKEEKRFQKDEENLKKASQSFEDYYTEVSKKRSSRVNALSSIPFVSLNTEIYTPAEYNAVKKYPINQIFEELYNSVSTEKSVLYQIKEIRKEITRKTIIVEMLINIFKNFYPEKEAMLLEIKNNQFAEINRIKAEFLGLVMNTENKLAGCYLTFAKRKKDIAFQLIFNEKKSLESLFEKTWSALGGLSDEARKSISDEKKEELNQIRKEESAYTQSAFYPQEYKESYGYSSLNAAAFTYYPMDAYARVKNYLEKSFPGEYEIFKPTNFEVETVYKKQSPSRINFDWSSTKEIAKQKFVQAGLSYFSETMSWSSEFLKQSFLENSINIFVELYKFGKFSIDEENIECDTEGANCISIKPEDLIKKYDDVLNFMNITKIDEEVLKLISKNSFFSQGDYESYIKRVNEHRLYAKYDLLYKRVFSDAALSGSESVWFLQDLTSYVDAIHRKNGSNFIFPFPKNIESSYREMYADVIRGYFARVSLLRDAISEKYTKEDSPSFNFRYVVDRTSMSTDYLSPLMKGKYEGLKYQINVDTSKYFDDAISAQGEKEAN